MVKNKVRIWDKDATIVINISGPPATGKTSLCKILSVVLSRNNIKFYYTSFTGFHGFSYLFSIILYAFFKLLNKVSSLCKDQKNRNRIHPYDCIPIEYTAALSKLLCLLEILSLYFKILIMILKINAFRPRVVLLDEGFPHIILNYIMFFHTRKFKLYKFLNKHVIRLLYLLKRSKIIVIFIVPSQDKAIEYWVKRDHYLPSSQVVGWIRIYYIIIPTIIKMMKESMNNAEMISFNNAKEVLRYILLKIVGAQLGSP